MLKPLSMTMVKPDSRGFFDRFGILSREKFILCFCKVQPVRVCACHFPFAVNTRTWYGKAENFFPKHFAKWYTLRKACLLNSDNMRGDKAARADRCDK